MPNGGPQLTARLSLDPSQFESNLKKSLSSAKSASAALGKIAFKIPLAGIRAAQKALKGFAATLASIGKGGLSGLGASALMGGWQGIGGAIASVGTKMVTGTQDAYEYGRAMMNLSRATGISKDKIAVMSLAMEDSQIQANETIMAIKMMDQLFLKAAHGVHSASTAFAQLGLNWKEIMHLEPAEAFEKVGAALAAVENPALRSAGAITIFGRTGAKMLKLFERGGALQLAREALGSQAGIVAKDGAAFEQVAIRLSHVGVKIRGIFMGIAKTILPTVDKFVKKFHAMDFTEWGEKIGNALNNAMSWLVTFWKEPGKTMDVWWAYAQLKARELGNFFLDMIERAFPGMGDAIMDAILITKAWGKIILGTAIDFGGALLNAGKAFIDYIKTNWEALGIADLILFIKHSVLKVGHGELSPEERGALMLGPEEDLGFVPSGWDNKPNFPGAGERNDDRERDRRLAREIARIDKPQKDQEDLVKTLALLGIGASTGSTYGIATLFSAFNPGKGISRALAGKPQGLAEEGWAELEEAKNRTRGKKDRFGAYEAGQQLAKAERAIMPTYMASRMFLAIAPLPDKAQEAWLHQTRNAGDKVGDLSRHIINMERGTGIQGASLIGAPWHDLGGFRGHGINPEATHGAGLLSHRELARFRNSAIAARSGRILAAGGDPSKLGRGEMFDPATMRRPGETANGDRRRAKAFAKEVARREAGEGTDNQLLGDISRNTEKSAKIMTEAFQ